MTVFIIIMVQNVLIGSKYVRVNDFSRTKHVRIVLIVTYDTSTCRLMSWIRHWKDSSKRNRPEQ